VKNDYFITPILALEKPPVLDDSPFKSPIEGCHLIVEWLGNETSANITFYLFDGTPDFRYKQFYEEKKKKKSKETNVKF
jgi:hypothetical protein